ncbi:MAG: hypothetical protein H0V17_09920, partial [Deltaproteobacteria bacterium]|nr:hypothetical protein [Deltaproteobacteria bacterium]
MRALALLLAVCTACIGRPHEDNNWWDDGKGDGFGGSRAIDVVMTEPFCDV